MPKWCKNRDRQFKNFNSQCIITFSWAITLFVVTSLVRSVVDVAAVVASVLRTVFTTLEPIDVAVVDDDSVATTMATLVVGVSTNSGFTLIFGAVELDVDCEGDLGSSVVAMVEEELIKEVDDDDDEDDDDGCDDDVVGDAFSVTNSSGLCYS